MAYDVEISFVSLYRIEKGETQNPGFCVMMRIAEILELKAEDLILSQKSQA